MMRLLSVIAVSCFLSLLPLWVSELATQRDKIFRVVVNNLAKSELWVAIERY